MSSNKLQRLIWPWETRKWPEIKSKITDKIHSIVDMDSRISSMHRGKMRPRQITELFTTYYADDAYAKDRVPQEVLINNIIPCIQKLIDNAQKTFRGFNSKLLTPGVETNISFTRPQVATIIACIWFGLFNYNYVSKGEYKIEDFPEPTLMNVFSNQNIFVLQCILNYFARVYAAINSQDKDEQALFNGSIVVLQRNVFPKEKSIDWINSDIPIGEICIGEGNVDDSPAKLHVVYAHDFIGGDMFKGSLTQEEVMLLTHPECLIATLFCARLESNEALTIFGAEKMSQYTGYGSSVKFVSNYVDSSPHGFSADETEAMVQRCLIFIDASPRTSGQNQYIHDFDRDLTKAFIGFNSISFSKSGTQISTGNWTYGFNGNNMQIKFIQQILAAAAADKCLIYHPFGRDFEDRVLPFIDWIMRNDFTIGDLYALYIDLMKKCCSGPHSRLNDLDVFSALMDMS